MIYRIFQPNDGYFLAKWFTDPDYVDFFRTLTAVPTIDDFCNWPKYTNQVIYSIHNSEGICPIGYVYAYNFHSINRSCQAGIVFSPEYKGKGFCREALIEWYDYCIKKFGIRKIIAIIVNRNFIEPLKSIGFFEEGVHLKECKINGIFVDEYRLALFAHNLGKRGELCQQQQPELLQG